MLEIGAIPLQPVESNHLDIRDAEHAAFDTYRYKDLVIGQGDGEM